MVGVLPFDLFNKSGKKMDSDHCLIVGWPINPGLVVVVGVLSDWCLSKERCFLYLGSELGTLHVVPLHSGFDLRPARPEEMSDDPLPAVLWHGQTSCRKCQGFHLLPLMFLSLSRSPKLATLDLWVSTQFMCTPKNNHRLKTKPSKQAK